jgi:hypothetical protein
MGLLEDLTTYLWNWLVYMKQLASIYGCFAVGGWGLFWDDDDGAFMLYCYELFGGSTVTYPAYYMSSYATAA